MFLIASLKRLKITGGFTHLHEGETVFLGQDGVGVLADLTRHVLENVTSQHRLDLRRLEATLNNQPLASVH